MRSKNLPMQVRENRIHSVREIESEREPKPNYSMLTGNENRNRTESFGF